MTKEPFIAHSEITDEIYIVCGTEKYLVTEQVIKAMQNTGRLEQQPSEDCISRQAVLDKAWDVPYEGKYVQVVDVGDIQELPPVIPTFPKGATNGDMIKAMFPKCCSNMGNFDNGIVVDFMGDLHSFDMEWWNAPYKQGNEKWIPENISYDNVQEKVATQRELICNLNAMNDELQAKLDKIEQITNKWISLEEKPNFCMMEIREVLNG